MKKRRILLAVIAIIAVCLAGEGIFTGAQAFQNKKTELSYEKTFTNILKKMEKMDDKQFGSIETPSSIYSITECNFNYEDQEFQSITEELDLLNGKLSASVWADAFLDYDFGEMAQYFLATCIGENCRQAMSDVYSENYDKDIDISIEDDKTDFSKEGDAFLKVLSSNKVYDQAKNTILFYMQPSKKTEDIWMEYKMEALSKSKTSEEFQHLIRMLFTVYDYNNEIYPEGYETELNPEQKQLLSQCDEWIANPEKISPVIYICAIQTKFLLQQEELTEEQQEKFYAKMRTMMLESFETKDGESLFSSIGIIDWLYEQGGWENFSFLQTMSEKYQNDSSLYSLIMLNALRSTIERYTTNLLIELLKEDSSVEHLTVVIKLLNLQCQPQNYAAPISDNTANAYVKKLINQLPPEQQVPPLLENKTGSSLTDGALTRIVDLDKDGVPDQEKYDNSGNGYYEVKFACGDTLTYHFPEGSSTEIYLTEMRDLNKDGKNELLLFGYQDTDYFCLVMEKKEGSNSYTVVPTKSGEDFYFFHIDFYDNTKGDYSDNWIKEMDFS